MNVNALGNLIIGFSAWLAGSTIFCANKPAQDDAGASQPEAAVEWIEFDIQPQKISQKRLEHRLFPDQSKLQGDAAPILLRLGWEKGPQYWESIAKSRDILKQPDREFSSVTARQNIVLTDYDELQRAARCSHADWGFPVAEDRNLASIILSDVQGLRNILAALAVHCRADIAEGKIESGMEKISVGMAVSSHIGVTPFVVCKLVQRATTDDFVDRIQQLTQHSDTPNLYWALGNLPSPLIDLRPTIDVERRLITSGIPELQRLDESRSQEQWETVAGKLVGLLEFLSPGDAAQQWIESEGGQVKAQQALVRRARAILPALRPDLEEKVEGMSDAEVAVRYFVEQTTIINDVPLSLFVLPPAEGLPFMQTFSSQFNDLAEKEPIGAITAIGAPSIYGYAWFVERRIAALRTVEALRDYAARNHGRLPDGLQDIGHVPIPNDPFTGDPFEYELTDGVAQLVGPAVNLPKSGRFSPAETKARFGIYFRIRVRSQ